MFKKCISYILLLTFCKTWIPIPCLKVVAHSTTKKLKAYIPLQRETPRIGGSQWAIPPTRVFETNNCQIGFSKNFSTKKNFRENLTSSCHGNTFIGVMSKSTNVAKIPLLVSLETWSHDNSDKIYHPKPNLLRNQGSAAHWLFICEVKRRSPFMLLYMQGFIKY